MKKYGYGMAMTGRKYMCCCTCINFDASDSGLFSKIDRKVVLHLGA